ncbi:CLUMA_CG017881, isoform A [Clunio marinus]|uniref:CLUMA_CG017881, isoform A n=1 Tax=Clunio marinus TaxID=568069 RepID=A0A1J1IZ61_9DIPT|nr:CLUMA_CG017881, isoform A [Clunio marinus]
MLDRRSEISHQLSVFTISQQRVLTHALLNGTQQKLPKVRNLHSEVLSDNSFDTMNIKSRYQFAKNSSKYFNIFLINFLLKRSHPVSKQSDLGLAECNKGKKLRFITDVALASLSTQDKKRNSRNVQNDLEFIALGS